MKKYLTSMIIISTGFMVACGQGKFKSNTEIQSQQSKASQAEMGKAKKMQEEASKRIEEATKKVNEANEALKRAKAESDKAKGVENYEEKMKSLDQRLAEIAKAEQASVDAKKELDQARVELEKIKDQTPEERALEEERIEQQRKAIADLVKHNEEFMKSLDSMQAQITKETAEVGEYSLERLKAYEEAPANVLLVLHGHISKDYLDGFRNEFLEKVKDNVHGNRFFDNDGSGIYSGFKRVRDRYLVSATYT
ncbi:MAG: hypothetical protein KDD50_15855, partial [Bdellovibrionales bacterium]|nr:hypothetical protein [Bdellovibrionales bacterium]